MGTIVKKKIKERNYYYYVETKRVNGKSRFVNQKYLGTADKLLKIALDSKKSIQDQVLYAHEVNFGAVALLYDAAMKLGIVDIIDRIAPKRAQGASVGMYFLIAAINRAVSPSSKSGLKDWYEKTALTTITGLKPSLFTAQNFWNNTNISIDQLRAIEDEILQRMASVYKIDLSSLIYDATNFFTYIDTMNPSKLAKRGHDKAKRNDLKTVGLALTVTPDYSIPIMSEVYPGNKTDSSQFADTMKQMKKRFRNIAGKDAEITIVFDRGNNSLANISLLEEEGLKFHYVGGLRKDQVPDLFAVPKNQYQPLECPKTASEKYRNLSTFRMHTKVLGRTMTTVVIHNPELERGQLQGIYINIEKTTADFLAMQGRLLKRAKGEIKGGKKPTADSIQKAIDRFLAPREFMKDVFEYEILEKDGHLLLTFAFSDAKLAEITERQLGKTALFTDRDDLTDYQIISAYRSAWHVEHSFRQMKDTDFLTVRPIFHWTDPKIAIHIFICVLAYRLCAILRKDLASKGIVCSIHEFLKSMGAINHVTTFYGDLSAPKTIEAFIKGDELSEKIEKAYNLKAKYQS